MSKGVEEWRQQNVGEWTWHWERGDRRLGYPFTFLLHAASPHRYTIKCANGFTIVTITLRWSPTPEEITTYLNTAEVYYADDIQQENQP